MLPLLIPLLSLLVGISKAEEVTKFTEVVEIRFIAKMNPTSNWTDDTIYDPPDPNHILKSAFYQSARLGCRVHAIPRP